MVLHYYSTSTTTYIARASYGFIMAGWHKCLGLIAHGFLHVIFLLSMICVRVLKFIFFLILFKNNINKCKILCVMYYIIPNGTIFSTWKLFSHTLILWLLIIKLFVSLHLAAIMGFLEFSMIWTYDSLVLTISLVCNQ